VLCVWRSVGLAEAHGNGGFDFSSINASLPNAASVCLKVISAVGDLVRCEILMILI